ncbi:MAG: hypothetical protein IKO62_00010 [Bacteroidales bacterium]|nr:hypothetical protein [Bacteroidales bacterium]
MIFTISRRSYYVFQCKTVLRREEIVEALSYPHTPLRFVWGYREEASPRPEPERVSCEKSVRLPYGYMSRRDILFVTPHKAAGRSVGYVKCGVSLRSANVMCTEGPDKPAAK